MNVNTSIKMVTVLKDKNTQQSIQIQVIGHISDAISLKENYTTN